jgi:hypothetical protein
MKAQLGPYRRALIVERMQQVRFRVHYTTRMLLHRLWGKSYSANVR